MLLRNPRVQVVDPNKQIKRVNVYEGDTFLRQYSLYGSTHEAIKFALSFYTFA